MNPTFKVVIKGVREWISQRNKGTRLKCFVETNILFLTQGKTKNTANGTREAF